MTAKRYFVTCEVGDCICELISRKLSDDEFEHLTYQDITDRLNNLVGENEVCKGAYNEIKSDAIRLKNENEQLKQKLELYGEIYPTGKWITKLNSEELEKELRE